MTAQDALRGALRDAVGPALRRGGYKGSAPTWRRSTDTGDWAVVNVQSSPWSSRQSVRCIVNIAVAPEPFLAWSRHLMEHLPSRHHYRPVKVVESDGLFRTRLQPSDKPEGAGETWWEVVDEPSALAAAADMVGQLERIGLPKLTELLDRRGMLAAIRAHDLGDIHGERWTRYFLEAEAILLAENGPTPALEEALRAATTHWADPWTNREQLLHSWIRARTEDAGLGSAVRRD